MRLLAASRTMALAAISIATLAGCGGGGAKNSQAAELVVTNDLVAWEKAAGDDKRMQIEEFSTSVRQHRDGLDQDGDGNLSAGELAAMDPVRQRGWGMYDNDKNGDLSRQEFDLAINPRFTMRDRNSDRTITKEEVPDGTAAGGTLY